MAGTLVPVVTTLLLLLFFFLQVSYAGRPGFPCHHHPSSFSYPDFSKNLRTLTLVGNARVHGPRLQVPPSGALFYAKPVFTPHASFSSAFSFSRIVVSDSSANADTGASSSLAFILAPHRPPLRRNSAHGHHDIDHTVPLTLPANSSAEDGPLSDVHSNRIFAWIDYLAPLSLIEVRLSRSQHLRPLDPVLSYRADLSHAWRKNMFVGFRSLAPNSPEQHVIYSWSFSADHSLMRPRPLRPLNSIQGQDSSPYLPDWHKSSQSGWNHELSLLDDAWLDSMNDVWRIVVSLLFGAACGTAAAAILLALWSCIRKRCAPSTHDDDTVGFLYGYQELKDSDEKSDTIEKK